MLHRRRRPRLRPALRRARRRIEQADPAEAAATFEKKAQAAEEQGMWDKAGDLHLEAARCYLQLDDIDRADDHGLKALQLFIQARRPGKVRRMVPRMMAVLHRKGYHDEAEKLLTESLEKRRRVQGHEHERAIRNMVYLGWVCTKQHRYDEAETILLDAFELCSRVLGPVDQSTVEAVRKIVELYEAWNKPDEAVKWQAKLPPK